MTCQSNTFPSNTLFKYNRANAPLFFFEPSVEEKKHWKASIPFITREYFRSSKLDGLCSKTPLSNGVTTGEVSMFLLLNNHEKRSHF